MTYMVGVEVAHDDDIRFWFNSLQAWNHIFEVIEIHEYLPVVCSKRKYVS